MLNILKTIVSELIPHLFEEKDVEDLVEKYHYRRFKNRHKKIDKKFWRRVRKIFKGDIVGLKKFETLFDKGMKDDWDKVEKYLDEYEHQKENSRKRKNKQRSK